MAEVVGANVMAQAEQALLAAEALYLAKKAEFEQMSAAYAKLRGAPAPGSTQDLVRQWLPKLATYAGLPGAAGLVTAITADPGSFSGLVGVAKRLLAVLGVG